MEAANRNNFSATDTVPGSEARLRVMEQRYASNQPIFHPLDRKDDLTQAIRGREAGNGVILKTTEAVDIRAFNEAADGKLETLAFVRQKNATAPNGAEPKKFSSILRIFRKRSGFTQKQLADLSGVSLAALKRFEYGEREPCISVATAILRSLGQSLRIGSDAVA